MAGGKASPGSPVTVVSRSPDKLDVFVVGTDGGVWTAAWQPGDSTFRGWSRIGNLTSLQGSMVGVVSRSQNKLDIVVTGTDGAICTAAWQAGDTDWRGWPPWPGVGLRRDRR